MPLFQCSSCCCVENAALCNYWERQMKQLPRLCSACNPEIQQWHGYFPRQSAVGYFVDAGGHLWQSPEQPPSTYTIIGQITETENAQTLMAHWAAQQCQVE